MKKESILVVDDEEDLLELVRYNLSKEGYDVSCVTSGEEGLQVVTTKAPQLVILDLMLPGKDGYDVCKEIRQVSNVPIIMLTAKDSEVDKVVGLELGADDYVTKPYSSRELVARIHAVLRRNGDTGFSSDGGHVLVAGPVRMDTERHQVSVNSVTVNFPLKEFELLEFLMRNSGRVVTRMQLIDRVWGSDYVGDTKTLDVHIKRLRAKIEMDPANPSLIQTVRGLGYKMES